MAHVFLDDGSPEAAEFDSYYVYFDERLPESIRRAQQALHVRGLPRAGASLDLHMTEWNDDREAVWTRWAFRKWLYTTFLGYRVIRSKWIRKHRRPDAVYYITEWQLSRRD